MSELRKRMRRVFINDGQVEKEGREKIGNAEGKKGMRSPKRGTPRRIEINEVSK